MGSQKALASGLSGAGVAFGAVQFFATFHWLFVDILGVPQSVGDELTTVCNMMIGFAISYALTYFTPNKQVTTDG